MYWNLEEVERVRCSVSVITQYVNEYFKEKSGNKTSGKGEQCSSLMM